MYVYVKEDRFV